MKGIDFKMDKNVDFNNYYGFGMYPPYSPYEAPDSADSNMYNPIMQYEQAYMYYRYLTQQLDYKIKGKEYEKLSSKDSRSDRRAE